jgi:GPH family glycoside/pentoside/hexuronide:cation symporter
MSDPAQASTLTRFGFGAGDFAFNLFWSGTSLFLLYFYTDVMGLSPVAAGLVYFVAMAWDAVSDPMMGIVADRTRSRWGRYRPYLLFGAVPLAASYPLAYWNPGFEGAALFAWALFTHCLLRTAYTAVSIPYTSLQARLSTDANERAVLAGWRMIGAGAGALVVAMTTPILVRALGNGDTAQGWLLAASVIGAVSVAIFWFCFAAMREPPIPDEELSQRAPPLLEELATFANMIRENGPLLRIFLLVTVSSIAGTMFGKNILYFFKYNLNAPEMGSVAVVVPAVMLFFGVPFWVAFARRTSKRLTTLVCAGLGIVFYLAFYFNQSTDPWVSIAIMAMMGFCGAGGYVMFWAMLPDTVEYGEAQTGVRNEAKVFGFASFAQKAALGVNALLLGGMLQWSGYTANQAQSTETLEAIKAIMTWIPIAGAVCAIALMWRYPINAKFHADLIAKIKARKTGTASGNQAA